MTRLLIRGAVVLGGLFGILVVLGYCGLLDNTFLGPTWDSVVRGYPKAKTAQEAADSFKRAVKERDYKMAAKYCTDRYAEQLRRGAKGAREMGLKMDDLTYQMKERSYSSDDSKVLFALLDPFPSDITITLKESGDEAYATFTFASGLQLQGQDKYENWQLDPRMFNVFWKGPVKNPVRLVKEKDAWKFDFNVEPTLQQCVDRMNEKSPDYVHAYTTLSQEVKNEPATKENVRGRLKTLMEEAAK